LTQKSLTGAGATDAEVFWQAWTGHGW